MSLHDHAIERASLAPVEQPLLYQHCRIRMPGGDVLGEDVFRLVRFQGQEAVSDLFEYQLELHGNDDPLGKGVDFAEIIGRPITVGIGCGLYQDSSDGHRAFLRALDGSGPRGSFALFDGIVAAFAIDIPGVYHITMRPAAWRMSLTNRYRIFTQKSVRDVLAQLCREHGVQASFSGLSGADNLASCRVQDWLQAGETDLEFMRRLMGKAHIFHYFTHSAGGHEMVFDNRPVYPPSLPGDAPLRYTYTSVDELGLHQSDTVVQYNYQEVMGTSGVECVFTLQKEAWDVRQPGDPLATFTSFRADSRSDNGDLPFRQYKIVQYGFSDAQAREYAQATDSAMRAADRQFSGASLCPLLRCGHRFRMRTPMPDVRPALNDVDFVLTRVEHESSLDGEYNNRFSATPANDLIAMTGLQDTQQGVVLAHVTTPAGSEAVQNWPYYIPDDFELGRQWLEDRQAVHKRLNAKGVYVRFSCDPPDAPPVWVKLAAHMQTIPEVGASVWVSRANDESELPEIQNLVQADGSSTITDSGWTAHSQVGNSYSTSYGDGRSIRFGQTWSRGDVQTAVGLVENAYARKLFRETSYSRGGSYGYSESENREKGMLNEGWSFGSTYSYGWSLEQRSFNAAGTSHHQSVVGKSDPAQIQPEPLAGEAQAAVQSSLSKVYGDTYSNSESYGATKAVAYYDGRLENDSTHVGDVVSNTDITGATISDSTHTGDVTSTTTITGTTTTTSTHNGDVVSDTTISGTTRNDSTHHGKVSSTTNVYADSDNTSTITGLSTNRNTHAQVHNFNLIGAQSSSSAIGANDSNDAIGAVLNLTATGVSGTVSVVGSSNTVNVVGLSTSVEIAGPGAHLSVKAEQATLEIGGPKVEMPVIILVL